MSAHVTLNLLNELGKKDKMRGLQLGPNCPCTIPEHFVGYHMLVYIFNYYLLEHRSTFDNCIMKSK